MCFRGACVQSGLCTWGGNRASDGVGECALRELGEELEVEEEVSVAASQSEISEKIHSTVVIRSG